MKIKNILKTLSLLSLSSTALVAAPNGVYVELGGGLSTNETIQEKKIEYTFSRDFILDASLGYQYNRFRGELELRHKKDSFSSAKLLNGSSITTSGELIQNTQMLNFYYSGYNSSKFVTSVGVGAGITTVEMQESYKESNIPSFQAILSVGYQITPKFIFTTKYNYFYRLESGTLQSEADNLFLFSLRYIF